MTKFSVATSERWKDKQGNKQDKTEWHNCECWGKQGEVIAQYFSKGSQILLDGSVHYQENDGKWYTTVKVSSFHFVDSKSSGGGQQQQTNNSSGFDVGDNGNNFGEPPVNSVPVDDDLPF